LTFATIAILLSKIIIYDGIVSFLAGYAMLVGLRRAIFFTVISMGMAGIDIQDAAVMLYLYIRKNLNRQ